MSKDIPKISAFVRSKMPKASEAEMEEATINLRNFLDVAYRILLRLEREKDEKHALDE